jgi:hypothetical protein
MSARGCLGIALAPLAAVLGTWLGFTLIALIELGTEHLWGGALHMLPLFLLFGSPIAYVVTGVVVAIGQVAFDQPGWRGSIPYFVVPVLVGATVMAVAWGGFWKFGPDSMAEGAAMGALGGFAAGTVYWLIVGRVDSSEGGPGPAV